MWRCVVVDGVVVSAVSAVLVQGLGELLVDVRVVYRDAKVLALVQKLVDSLAPASCDAQEDLRLLLVGVDIQSKAVEGLREVLDHCHCGSDQLLGATAGHWYN
eukprot:2108824-Amphidinium_carterae.3